jgi:hypothetical protein
MINEPYYPIGIQNFEKLRSLNAVYVDKTDLIYRMVHTSTTVFLSRPRRFGKSLLSSTLHYYFEGRKDLFTGLAMEKLETEWTQYPVLHFDLSLVKSEDINNIKSGISRQLKRYEKIYGSDQTEASLSSRMADLIERAFNQTNQKVVVLIDEYDAPILDVMHEDEKREEVRRFLREFYSPLKACDEYLRFVFLTGISMFSQLSIFSELNNLEIISRSSVYASICGITEQELKDNFQYGIEKMANSYDCSYDEMITKLRDAYDGYHFCEDTEGIYNPFSLLNALKSNRVGSYWFASGTPRFLIEMLKRYKQRGSFKLEDLDRTRPITERVLDSPIESQKDPLPLLYQSGYLTIKDYERESSLYVLSIPNTEVRVGLLQNLLPLYIDIDADDAESIAALASTALRKGDAAGAMELFKSMLASVPFMRGDNDILADAEKTEAHYHIIFYFFFRMLHREVLAEVRNAKGATDVVIKTPKYIYVVEIKIDTTADVALNQIEEKGYATPYLADGREVIKLGINFSTDTRNISEWKQA